MSYTGMRVKIPLGESGIITDVAPDKVPPGSLLQAQNICYFNGSVEKAPGAFQWNQTAVSAGIVGAHFWVPDINVIGNPRFIALTSDGNIYKGRDRVFGSPINSTIASVLTPNCIFAEGGAEQASNPRKLFMFTGGATLPYVLTGDATAAHMIGTPAVDWTSTGTFPKFGVVHRGQLYAFAGQISYSSSASDHENFATTASVVNPVYPGEGGELRGAFVFKGRLFCFKDGGFAYGLVDTDPSQLNWYWQKVASNFGLAAPNAVAEVLDDMLVGNTYGTLTSYAATFALGSVEAADLMQLNGFDRFMREYVSKSGVLQEHLMYYAEKKQLFLTCRSTYSTQNDSVLMLDFGRQGKVRPSIWTKGSPQCLAKWKDVNSVERPMYGGADGFLYFMDYMDRLEGGAVYKGAFQTQHLDFSHADPQLSAVEKQFDFIAVHYVPSNAAAQLSCDYYIDGRYIDTINFYLAQYTKPTLDTMTLDVDRAAAGNTETSIQIIKGAGKTLSAYFYNSGSNQSFAVPAITVYFRGGGDKAQQT
jgi:hypothetical protein